MVFGVIWGEIIDGDVRIGIGMAFDFRGVFRWDCVGDLCGIWMGDL